MERVFFTAVVLPAGVDHGGLAGLTDQVDHLWALLIDGTRELTADWDAGAFRITTQDLTVGDTATVGGLLTSSAGRIVNTDRVTGDTTLNATHHQVFCDTDGGAITTTLPAGVDGTKYIIYNTGSSSNAVTITPNGSELLYGVNSNYTILDGGAEVATFETTEGWR